MAKLPLLGADLLETLGKIKETLFLYRMWTLIILSILVGFFVFTTVPPAEKVLAASSGKKNTAPGVSKAADREPLFSFEDVDIQSCKIAKFEEKDNIFALVDDKKDFEKELYEIVGDHPIKEMVPYIAEKDRVVAAFLVGIAKKESNWGKRVPLLNGQDCYNYWGYKGHGKRGSSMGYGCFASPKEAIEEVGGRLEELVGKKLDTPKKMIVWKCGSSCAGHDPKGVSSWINDVGAYFSRISNKKA